MLALALGGRTKCVNGSYLSIFPLARWDPCGTCAIRGMLMGMGAFQVVTLGRALACAASFAQGDASHSNKMTLRCPGKTQISVFRTAGQVRAAGFSWTGLLASTPEPCLVSGRSRPRLRA